VQEDLFDLDFYIDENEVRKNKKIKLNEYISQEPFPDEEAKIKLYDLGAPQSEMKKRRERLRKEREKDERQKQKDKIEGDPNKGDFEVVPVKTFDDYGVDDLAATRALAKKMFRKKTRESIIENSFSRHTMFGDENLPKWFKDDEDKHQYKIDPITKDEFQAEKQKLLAINAKVPKKVKYPRNPRSWSTRSGSGRRPKRR
jgi:AdoMet-dependent rRNA methyltransferase SPB1